MTASQEAVADKIMDSVMQRVDGLVAMAKLGIANDDGGKVGTLTTMAHCVEEALAGTTEMSRFISVLLVDRAIKELAEQSTREE
jgi:hypothetical protein